MLNVDLILSIEMEKTEKRNEFVKKRQFPLKLSILHPHNQQNTKHHSILIKIINHFPFPLSLSVSLLQINKNGLKQSNILIILTFQPLQLCLSIPHPFKLKTLPPSFSFLFISLTIMHFSVSCLSSSYRIPES